MIKKSASTWWDPIMTENDDFLTQNIDIRGLNSSQNNNCNQGDAVWPNGLGRGAHLFHVY